MRKAARKGAERSMIMQSMSRDDAREYIKSQLENYLQRKGIDTRGTFRCLNPEHEDKNPSMSIDRTSKSGLHCNCFSCHAYYDTLELIGIDYGLTEYNDQLKKGCELYGIELEPSNDKSDTRQKRGRSNMEEGKQGERIKQNGDNADYTAQYEEWGRHRGESDYLSVKRGISNATQEYFSTGYCSEWRHPKAPKMKLSPRVIIPSSEHSYLARYVGEGDFINWEGKEENKSKVGKQEIFNRKALEDAKEPVFVVEGEIDAMSVYEVGHSAVALGSTSNYKKFLAYVKEHKPKQILLIALDNDKSGKETIPKLIAGLQNLNIDYHEVNISEEHKDPNDYLVADRKGFISAVEKALEDGKNAKEAEKQEYIETSALTHLMEFMNGISARVNTPYTPTGFKELDRNLDGGLYEGLYVIGAISSLGKTTLALQIADQVAQGGRDVLIFSLEMARNELIAKSLSRLTAQIAISENKPIEQAKTTRGITVYKFYKTYSREEKDLILDAVDRYGQYAEHIFITEGIGDIGVEEIRGIIKKHISITGNTPVVVIDYLQIIAPYNDRATDKQNTDKAVLELKRMSRDYKLPVIGISSFNRDNYNAAVSMQAFKESGAIEYSSDVLIGLQLAGTGSQGFDVDRAKSQDPRSVEAKILKNRNGRTGTTVLFDYYPRFNYFRESADTEVKIPSRKPKQSKRDKERARLENAFAKVQVADEASLGALADELDISKKKVANMIAEYGGYVLEGDIVKIDPVNQFFESRSQTSTKEPSSDE